MSDIITRAAKRFGRRNPTADEVLMEAFPNYTDSEHGRLYHRMFDAVIDMVGEMKSLSLRQTTVHQFGICDRDGCTEPLIRHGRYCSPGCYHESRGAKRGPRNCTRCGDEFTPPDSRRKLCPECSRRHIEGRMSDDQVRRLRKMLANGALLRELAEKFGVSPKTAWAIGHGHRYQHVTDGVATNGRKAT